MDSLVWIAILLFAMIWAGAVELKRYNSTSRFRAAWDNGFSNFLITFSEGSAKCLDFNKAPFQFIGTPVLRLQYNQENWIISLHFDTANETTEYPTKLSMHIEGVGRIILRKDRARSKQVMYRAAVLTPQSLHYVSRRAVIGG